MKDTIDRLKAGEAVTVVAATTPGTGITNYEGEEYLLLHPEAVEVVADNIGIPIRLHASLRCLLDSEARDCGRRMIAAYRAIYPGAEDPYAYRWGYDSQGTETQVPV
jgi:hypothetical protein